MRVSSMGVMLDPCSVTLCIMIAYGHASARSVLHRRRAAQLLAGCRAARRDATRGEPPDPFAREAARAPAPRPFRTPCRADRGGAPALPERAAPARPRGAAP